MVITMTQLCKNFGPRNPLELAQRVHPHLLRHSLLAESDQELDHLWPRALCVPVDTVHATADCSISSLSHVDPTRHRHPGHYLALASRVLSAGCKEQVPLPAFLIRDIDQRPDEKENHPDDPHDDTVSVSPETALDGAGVVVHEAYSRELLRQLLESQVRH